MFLLLGLSSGWWCDDFDLFGCTLLTSPFISRASMLFENLDKYSMHWLICDQAIMPDVGAGNAQFK